MALLHYISHPNVLIDPKRPVPDWSLNAEGRRRAKAMLTQPWVADVSRVVSSEETKAFETAEILCRRLGLSVESRAELGELDRSSTGFVSHDRHAALADQCFAEPDQSASGWERAVDAQERVAGAASDLLVDGPGDIAIIGHGGVGTLLYCRLAGLAIDRRHDQPGQGYYWSLDRATGLVLSGWQPIDPPA